MGFFRHSKGRRSFDLLSSYDNFVPDGKECIFLMLFFALGICLGLVAAVPIIKFGGTEYIMYAQTISYVLFFIPAMLYAARKSAVNAGFDLPAKKVDSNGFAPLGVWECIATAVAVTVCAAIVTDPIAKLLPPMSEQVRQAMEIMTKSPLWICALNVCIFAPFFEEWLCRGMILRGMLSRTAPSIAIMTSAIIFALIHMNLWQGVSAFLLGCVFGIVYYRTGSLKLTMLMHFTNNALCLALARVDKFSGYDTLMDALGGGASYWAMYAVAAVILVAGLARFRKCGTQE